MPIINNEEANTGGTGSALNIPLFTPFEETVETVQHDGAPGAVASLNYSDPIWLPSVKVTFDDAEYICKGHIDRSNSITYGREIDDEDPFADQPFILRSTPNGNIFITETAGTYTVKIEPSDESVKLMDIVVNGRSVNAALMRFLISLNVFPDLSDSNSMLIDKIRKAFTRG